METVLLSFLNVFLTLLIFLSPQAGGEAASQVRPSTQTKSCTENGCHAEVTDFAVLHGPLNAGGCSGCHDYKNVSEHTFQMTRPGNDLCYFCHQIESGTRTHEPVTEEGCLECHHPHGGAAKTHLRANTTRALCEQCHDNTVQGRLIHEPISTGGCLACHATHRSNFENLLRQETTVMCLDCHVVFADKMKQSRIVHDPVGEDCLECHDAHASNNIRLLKEPMKELCFSCHEDIEATVKSAQTPHGALEEIGECINCHDSHAANSSHLLRNTTEKLCLECHNREIRTPNGKIPDMTPILATGNSLHGPLTINDCTECHQIHGGARPRLLVKEYPNSFYFPFKESSYELCFSCHNPEMVLVPRTTSLTDFRDGDRNLHFVHVNQQEKGRTCRACHEIHSGELEKHISQTAYFGDWKIPIGFSINSTGGSCSPGCHERFSYDRQNPVRDNHPDTNPAGSQDVNGEE
ncbi:MAG: cytochrome c3 family protein [Acidobacteriota bacterium]